MLSTACVAIFLVVHIIFIEAAMIKTFYGIKTKEYPKSSCYKIPYIISKSVCLSHCTITTNMIVMISHDDSKNTCMCCSDITGNDITGPNWKSYVPRPVSYSKAQANCEAKGADLIKIDSKEKYDIFKDYHDLVPIANYALIEVWVQGEKVGGQWKFDDGSPVPDFCPIRMSGGAEEIHLRARSNTFTCSDAPNSRSFNYSCEYHRLLSFNN